MCRTCGCDEVATHHTHEHPHPLLRPPPRVVKLEVDLLAKNDQLAHANRAWLAARGIAMINLIGSPGAGKTALLEASIARLRPAAQVSVLEGDQATDRDAERIARTGAPVRQINTGAGCHLDATMVADGLRALDPPRASVVLVENVGNLVCPALFDLGERAKVVVMSVTEGEDKPIKYPHVFRAADLFVLTKCDLAPHLDFDADQCVAFAHTAHPGLPVLRVSARTGEGIDAWCRWVRDSLLTPTPTLEEPTDAR